MWPPTQNPPMRDQPSRAGMVESRNWAAMTSIVTQAPGSESQRLGVGQVHHTRRCATPSLTSIKKGVRNFRILERIVLKMGYERGLSAQHHAVCHLTAI